MNQQSFIYHLIYIFDYMQSNEYTKKNRHGTIVEFLIKDARLEINILLFIMFLKYILNRMEILQ